MPPWVEYSNDSCCPSVHPHMRGEYLASTFILVFPIGSPPHAWGIRLSILLVTLMMPVHPHMRGEYRLRQQHLVRLNGSPPHAWGIPNTPLLNSSFERFTPTCVGNTFELKIGLQGKRFTPTCVGNTSQIIGFRLGKAVHPHMRGEYAGTICFAFRRAVHPHMRGEYGLFLGLDLVALGSPPHAWGIRRKGGRNMSSHWFTPTCVGNTFSCKTFLMQSTVHPHMRGEYGMLTSKLN